MAVRHSIFAVTGDDVIRFTLSGRTVSDVETVQAGAGARCVAVDPGDPDRVYVGTFDSGLLTSEDAGGTWRRAESGIDEERVLAVAVSPSHTHDGVSVAYAGTEPSNLYRSEDAGRSWQRLPALRELPSERSWSFPPRPWTHHVRTIALHPADPDQLTVGIELGGVMRSRDGGATWIDHNPQAHSDAHQLLTHPLAPQRIYEAAGQGIAMSVDLGESWQRYDADREHHYAWAAAIDPSDPDLWYVSVSRSPFAAHGSGDGHARLMRSTANGNGWKRVDTWGDEPELRRMPYALAPLKGEHQRLLVGLRGGTLIVTDDAGVSWTRLSIELPDLIDLAAVAR
jgi:photosystem II stability/assembly factor-like uncharacterized protein